jgi:biopolymer transport protein ExbD
MKRSFLGRAVVIGLPFAAFLAVLAAFENDLGPSGIFETAEFLLVLVLFLVAAGVTFLLTRAFLQLALRAFGPLRIFPEIPLRYSLAFRQLRPAVKRPELPDFGMYWGWIMMVQMIGFWIMPPRIPTGLLVRVPSLYVAERPRAPESESLGVYVGTGGRYYVNGQAVAREQLRARLQEELSRRSLWIVYFEGDEDVAYGQVVYAVETIRGLGAQAYFLSPRIRAEFNESASSTKR